MKRVILAISLIMLIGGIIGSVYCANKINERLDWAESIGNPEYTKQYNYRVVEDEVTSLGTYLGVSVDIAVMGGLAGLALIFNRRFRWEGVRGLAFSVLGAFIIIMPILVAFNYGLFGLSGGIVTAIGGLAGLAFIFNRRFGWERAKGLALSILGAFIILILILVTFNFWLFGGIVIAVIPFPFYLIVVFLLLGRRWIRGSVFILGGFLMMLGVFLAIKTYIWSFFDQDFQILYWFFIIIGIGSAILGILFSSGSICWPRQEADKVQDVMQVSLSH